MVDKNIFCNVLILIDQLIDRQLCFLSLLLDSFNGIKFTIQGLPFWLILFSNIFWFVFLCILIVQFFGWLFLLLLFFLILTFLVFCLFLIIFFFLIIFVIWTGQFVIYKLLLFWLLLWLRDGKFLSIFLFLMFSVTHFQLNHA